MRHLARATLTLAVLALLCAIWLPPWWAWLLTGVLLLLVGAAIGGKADMTDHRDDTDSGLEQEPVESRHVFTSGPLGDRTQRTPTYGRKADDQ